MTKSKAIWKSASNTKMIGESTPYTFMGSGCLGCSSRETQAKSFKVKEKSWWIIVGGNTSGRWMKEVTLSVLVKHSTTQSLQTVVLSILMLMAPGKTTNCMESVINTIWTVWYTKENVETGRDLGREHLSHTLANLKSKSNLLMLFVQWC